MIETAKLPLLVTGASGNLGRMVIDELLSSYQIPPDRIIAATRTPHRLDDLASLGVTVRAADFDDPATLIPAFSGARRMLVVSTTPEAPYIHGKRLRQQTAAIAAGVEAGITQIIYTSAPNPEPGTPCFWKEDHYRTELALIESGVDWTILRHWEWPDWHFTENWRPAIDTGLHFAATGSGRISHVLRSDCARAAAGALVSDISRNRRFDITGPEALTIDEIMALLGRLTGREIKVIHITPEELGTRLAAQGTNPHFIPVFVAFAQAVRRGLFDGVSGDVERLSGRPPAKLGEYLQGQVG